MKFEELNDMTPYVLGGKQKVLTMSPYTNITLAMPCRHAADTTPKGGDFVVMVTGNNWNKHQFTHTDLFQDLELKKTTMPEPERATKLMESYLTIVKGGDVDLSENLNPWGIGLTQATFLYAVQCLAVAEHRRYAVHEAKWGGRYLPFRFGAGIVEGLWTAADAADKQKRGRPGVEWLERDHGTPLLTKELING